jgi:two-component system, LuxR family, response regulator FixJ
MANENVVHIIDDDDDARESLAFLLSTADIEVHVYESAVAFLKALPQVNTGCVITDVRMPDMDGMELLRHLNENGAALPVIVMTGHGDVPLAVEAMKLGAIDFLEKPFDDDALLTAVRMALSKNREDSEQDLRRTEVKERLAGLSPREHQVLDGLIAGHPNKTIAFDLGISARTVEVYRANVMTKMHARSLSELVRMALLANNT